MVEAAKDYNLVPSPERNPNEKINTFHFDVSFYVIKKQKKVTLLERVSDVIQSGQTLAIMGPSGIKSVVLELSKVNELIIIIFYQVLAKQHYYVSLLKRHLVVLVLVLLPLMGTQ